MKDLLYVLFMNKYYTDNKYFFALLSTIEVHFNKKDKELKGSLERDMRKMI